MDVLGQHWSSFSLACGIAAALLVPGGLLLQLAGSRSRGLARMALAPGLSIALWAVVLLWASAAGVSATTGRVRALLLVLSLVWLLALRRGSSVRDGSSGSRASPAKSPGEGNRRSGLAEKAGDLAAPAAVLVITLIALATRISQADGLAVAPWVDGYHHTLVTQLIVDRGAVPTSLEPYLAIERFYYHFGFHALAAMVALLAGVNATVAVLWVGQALNALAVPATYCLTNRLTGRRVAAAAASAIPATLYFFPAYYVTWGRYTQLAGLIILPAAWVLLADGVRVAGRSVQSEDERADRAARSARASAGAALLASVAAAGLLLTHYRIFAFYLVGVLVLSVFLLSHGRSRTCGFGVGRLTGVGATGLVLVAPWLLQHLWPGLTALATTSEDWFRAPDSITVVEGWLFDVGTVTTNRLWLALAAVGAAVGAIRRRRSAYALIGVTVASLVLVSPERLGLPPTYFLPPFALAIAAFLPAAIGVGLLLDEILALGPGSGRGRRLLELAVLAGGIGLCAIGAWHMRSIVNPSTIIAVDADLAAADWIADNTALDACFLVNTTNWHMNTYRGSDGGYWLPLTARRPTTMPAALYNQGDADYARLVLALAEEVAAGDALTDSEIDDLMARTGARYVYVGPASAEQGSAFSPERLRRHVGLAELYARDGAHVFARATPLDLRRGAESVVCRPVARAPDPARE